MKEKLKRLLNKLSQSHELIIIITVAVVVYIFAFSEDLFEKIIEISRKYDYIQIDEIIIVLTVLSLLISFFYYNKWKEVKNEFETRKKIEANLRHSRQQYKELFENAHDAIIIFTPEDEVVLNVNERACEIYGYSRSEFIGLSLKSISIKASPQHINDTLQKGFYHSFETTQRRKDASEMELEINASVINYENQTAILSINRDVTERKHIEQAYRESEAKLKAIINNSSDIIFIFDNNLNYRFISPSFETITGYKIEEKLNKYLVDDIHPDDQGILLDLLNERNEIDISNPTWVELRYRKKDGEYVYSESIASSRIDSTNISGVVVNTRVITERKKVEKELLLYSHAIRNISDGIIITDINDRIIFVNQAFTNIYGYKKEEVLNQHPSILANYSDDIYDSINRETLKQGWHGELSNKRKDGSIFPIELTTSVIVNEKKETIGYIGVFKDISERKEAEEHLKNSENKYRLLAENSTDMIYVYSFEPEPHYQYISPSCESITGYTAEEGYADPFIYKKYFVSPEQYELFNEHLLSQNCDETPIIEKWRKKDGSYIWVEQVVTRNFNEIGKLISFQSTVRDVTERKLTEQALQESETRFRSLYENTTLGLFRFNFNGDIILANPAFVGILGYDSFNEVISLNLQKSPVYLDDNKRKEFRRIIESEEIITGFEVEWLKKDKSLIYVRLNGRAIKNNNEIEYFECTLEDITERMKAEQALRKSELLLETTQSLSKVGGWEFDLRTESLTWTQEVYRIHDMDPNDKITNLDKFVKLVGPLHSPQDFQKVKSAVEECIKNGTHFDLEFPITTLKGRDIWIRSTGEAVRTENNIIKVIGNVMDITSQKIAEAKLRDSERRFKSLYENATIGIFRTTPSGSILLANPAFVTLLGYDSEDELKTINLSQARVYYNLERRKEFLQEVDKKDVITGFEAKWYRRDGTIIYVLINARVFRDDEGNVLYHDGTIENITERKEAEEALRISEEQYRNFFEKDISGNYLASLDGDIINCNSAFAEIMGYDSAEELIGKNMIIFDPKVENIEMFVETLQEKKVVDQLEVDFVRKDKRIIHCVQNVVGVFDENGKLINIQGYMFDITEQKQAEEELKNSELKYRTVADWTYDWEYWLDPDRNVNYTSPSVKTITGYTAEEIISDPSLIYKMVIEEDLERVKQEKINFEENNSDNSPFMADYRILTKDSQIKWISHLERKIYSTSGEFIGIRASNRDVTENKKSLELITRLSTVIEQSPLSILITDSEGIIEYINTAGLKNSGYPPDKIIGKTPRIFRSGKTSKQTYEELWSTIKSGDIWTGELLNRKRDGELIWENVLISPIYDTLGNLSNFVSIREDVTEKKKNEKELARYREKLEELVEERTSELKQSEEKYRVLAENSEDVVIRYDKNLTIIYINKAIEEFFDTNYEELIGKSLYQINMPQDANDLIAKTLLNVFKTGIKSRVELEISGVWVDYIAVPELNLEGEVFSVVASARDITSIKESERKINEALQKEKELNDFKSKFIATASHQFRTPLASILSSSQMIKRYSKKWDENKINEHHTRIGDSITNLTQIMDDLLTIGKTEEGRYDIQLQELSLSETIEKLINEVDGVDQEDTRIILNNNSEQQIIKTDKKIFSEIVNNLLTNALKYSPSEEKVEVKLEDIDKFIQISITDHGIGISKDDQKYIFNSFFRGKNGLDIQGTGLGLNIVKHGVDLLRGDISIESELGKGTKVIVKFPLEYYEVLNEKNTIS